jgi:hypothetical protein
MCGIAGVFRTTGSVAAEDVFAVVRVLDASASEVLLRGWNAMALER